jgi:hypothetical protein
MREQPLKFLLKKLFRSQDEDRSEEVRTKCFLFPIVYFCLGAISNVSSVWQYLIFLVRFLLVVVLIYLLMCCMIVWYSSPFCKLTFLNVFYTHGFWSSHIVRQRYSFIVRTKWPICREKLVTYKDWTLMHEKNEDLYTLIMRSQNWNRCRYRYS